MLKELTGRAYTQLTKEDIEQVLTEEFKAFTPAQRHLLERMLQEFSDGGGVSELHQSLRELSYKREPVDMRTFVLDPYYLGDTCYSTFPKLLDDLEEVFSGDYNEIIWTGSIGCGKTFASSIGLCRVLYELSCLANPQDFYGLTPDTMIVLAGISANEDLAKEVVLKNVVGKIAASPYFKEHFPFKITQTRIRFPSNVMMVARATTPTSLLGMNLFAALVDEANFMPEKNVRLDKRQSKVNMAKVIYDTIKRRMFSRYGNQGKLFLPSSKSTVESFVNERIQEARTDPSIFVRDYALWDVREGFSDERFWVLCGNEQVQSRILTDAEAERLTEDRPDRTLLVHVPEDLRSKFESDLEGSLRDLAGVATVSLSPFIQRVTKVREMVDPNREHPFTEESFDPSVGGDFKMNLMVEKKIVKDFTGAESLTNIPIQNPSAPRVIHIDTALSNCAAGLCMAHMAGTVPVERQTGNFESYMDEAPLFVIDFVLQIVPPADQDLDFSLYEFFVMKLVMMGFPVRMVTSDQYQSVYLLQRLAKKGFRTEGVSMDRTWDPYQHLKQAIYEGRVRGYNYKPLMTELVSLEADWNKRKIIKPPGGSKDVSDAVAGCLYALNSLRSSMFLPMISGISSYGHGVEDDIRAELAMLGGAMPLDGLAAKHKDVSMPMSRRIISGSSPKAPGTFLLPLYGSSDPEY